MRAKPHLQSQLFFLVANVAAGFLHYLYQVFASRNLSGAEFAELNLWFADLALFFMVGGLLQYASNFFPAKRSTLLPALVGVNIFAMILAIAWFRIPSENIRAAMIIVAAAGFGWLTGQIQARMMFYVMAIANLLVGFFKLGVLVMPFAPPNTLEIYRLALFACYFPALWYVSIRLCFFGKTEAVKPSVKNSAHLWAAPVILSVVTAVIPQMDLALTARILSSETYIQFSRASLFYKGIYFLIFIVAQLVLPQQIAGHWNNLKPARFLAWALGISLIAPAAVTAIAPMVVHHVLGWAVVPSLSLIFFSCVNMSLLAWLLLLIQEACAREKSQYAGLALGVLVFEAGLQFLGDGSVNSYYALALTAQALLVIRMTYAVRKTA